MTTATERVGRYQLLEPIGIGPSGSVSRAKVFGVAGFERQFAVKRFHSEITSNPATAAALSAAARGYGSLEHPRIARMSEFGVAQGVTFTAVEYVSGLDALRLVAEARLADTTLAAGGALALVSQAARAVGYAHGRGLTHLGLAPTNVIVTSEGDIKLTDFGILASTLPPRPIDSSRLAHRIQYLSPEQLANEATSAATDVFALGVLAYELVTGQRTFRGETPAQIAQSVMAGPPAEPPLPRPIVRVLQRCLARSPFERFPDARALADALDAALRVAPVPGTRKDIGAQVTQTLDRIAAMNEGELSGMLALDIGTGPHKGPTPAPGAMLGRDSQEGLDISTLEFVRPDTPVAGPTPLVGPATSPDDPATAPVSAAALAASSSTMPDLPKPFTTVAGLPPPPIPVPQGVSVPSSPPQPAPAGGASTLLGIPSVKAPPAIPLARPSAPPRVPNIPGRAARMATPPPLPIVRAPTPPPVRTASDDDAARTGPRTERPSALLRAIAEADLIEPGDAPRETDPGLGVAPKDRMADPVVARAEPLELEPEPEPEPEPVAVPMPAPPAPALAPTPAPVAASRPSAAKVPSAAASATAHVRDGGARPRSRLSWILLGAVGVGALGVGGWFAYNEFIAKPDDAGRDVVAAGSPDGGTQRPDASSAPVIDAVAVARIDDAAAATPDAEGVASLDAGVPDAVAVAVVPPDASQPAVGDSLAITSSPSGARVFLDGADTGVTPLKLPGSPDRHTIAVLLPGHELYVAQVDGQGQFAIPLKEVTPLGGPAGIKVTRCKEKDRYYVFVDSQPTGMTCPTERIEVELGTHVVEVYDVVSDSRKKYEIEVKDTRLSYRVKIE